MLRNTDPLHVLKVPYYWTRSHSRLFSKVLASASCWRPAWGRPAKSARLVVAADVVDAPDLWPIGVFRQSSLLLLTGTNKRFAVAIL